MYNPETLAPLVHKPQDEDIQHGKLKS